MTRSSWPSPLDKRLVAESVSLALHPARVSDTAAVQVLVEVAGGNRTAVQRAIRTVGETLNSTPSHVGQRALDLLRNALDDIDGRAIA